MPTIGWTQQYTTSSLPGVVVVPNFLPLKLPLREHDRPAHVWPWWVLVGVAWVPPKPCAKTDAMWPYLMVDNLVERWQHLQENLLKREPGLLKRVLLAVQKCWKTRVGIFFFESLKFNMLYGLSIWFILTLLSSDLSYFCNWWKSLPLLESKRGLMWVCNFTSFVCWDLGRYAVLPAGAFGEIIPTWIPSWQRLATRNWWKVCVLFVGHEPGKNCFPEMWPTTSTAENTKEYPKWKHLLPTSNRHLQGFFWIFNLPGVFYFGKWRWFSSSKLYEVWAKKLVFYFGDFFGGFCKDGKGTWPISPCHPSKYTQYSTKFSFQNISLRHVS